jgi:hypothetical protein
VERPDFYAILALSRLNSLVEIDLSQVWVEIRHADCVAPHDIAEPTYKDPSPSIRKWLSSCLEQHSHPVNVSNAKTQYSKPKNIHVIDCEDSCVVKLQIDSNELSYAALSYVWGTVSQLTLTTQNYNILQHKGVLHKSITRLPHTIRDAMDLCVSLNVRYLWVDSLCIVQDNSETKQLHIANMHNIYQHAVITIVAAAGLDSGAGLPGLHPEIFKPPQFLCLNRFHLWQWKTNWGYFNSQRPKWAGRAWTMQEDVFSHRKVIFTEDHILCTCSVESVSYDHIDKNWLKIIETAEGRLITFVPRIAEVYPQQHPFLNFQHYLREYNKRAISMTSDNINAFTGIINSLEPHIGSCWFGIPLRAFANCSLFMVLYQASIPGKHPERAKGFPSWSWASWMIVVKEQPTVRINFDKIVSTVHFYRFDENGNISPLPHMDLGWELHASLQSVLIAPPTAEDLAQVKLLNLTAVPKSHLLLFHAWELQLFIGQSTPGSAYHPVLLKPDDDGDKESYLGWISVGLEWLQIRDQPHTFILYAVVNNMGFVEPAPILVQRDGDIAYRVNTCSSWHTSIEKWMELQPRQKLIVMA